MRNNHRISNWLAVAIFQTPGMHDALLELALNQQVQLLSWLSRNINSSLAIRLRHSAEE